MQELWWMPKFMWKQNDGGGKCHKDIKNNLKNFHCPKLFEQQTNDSFGL